jgi:mono/diheme cytochrome c family protein
LKNSAALVVTGVALFSVGCRQDMQDQPKYKPLHESNFFQDHRSERPQIDGTVARGHLRIDQARYTGKFGADDVTTFPWPITRQDLNRGQQRYNIYCSPCHSRVGDGEGMIVLRGFRQPPSYHIQRLKDAPVGHFFDVVTNGFGSMPSYASRVSPDDRWRVIAYVRVLQFAEGASLADVPADQRNSIEPQPASNATQPTNLPPANPAIAPVGQPAPNQGEKK